MAVAAATIARAIGCSEWFSTEAARRSASARSTSAAVVNSSSDIRPLVTVPVLSSTIVSILRVCSSACGPVTRMPSCAARPVPTRRAGEQLGALRDDIGAPTAKRAGLSDRHAAGAREVAFIYHAFRR